MFGVGTPTGSTTVNLRFAGQYWDNEDIFSNLPPKKIVPKLADEGIYIASESSFYRVLKAADQLKHRNKSKQPRKVIKLMELVATAPNQVYSWEGLPLLGI